MRQVKEGSLRWQTWGWLILFVVLFGVWFWQSRATVSRGKPLQLALLSTTADEDAQQSRAAFESVLTEEGLPHRWYGEAELLAQSPRLMAAAIPAVILPDSAARQVSSGMASWLRTYTEAGGTLVTVYGAATESQKGTFYFQSPLRGVTGIESARYSDLGKQMYQIGSVRFTSAEAARLWGVTPGKLSRDLTLYGYGYGQLAYSMIAAHTTSSDVKVWAKSPQGYPILSTRRAGLGQAMWVNLQLGALKASGDDLPLRLVLRRVAALSDLPHLLPVPQGRGTLLINWHVDANPDWQAIPELRASGVLSRTIRNSFHITAGPDRDRPGDQFGFDACGKGRAWAELLKSYGTLGDHGGWAHQIFSHLVLDKGLTPEAVKLVDDNTACVESVLGRKVVEYSAPNGIHPQPEMTRLLEQRGFVTYYYTGDTGSPPNRTFSGGQQVSAHLIAAPVTPYHQYASLAEFARAGITPAEVERWLLALTDYVRDERTMRLIYTHPYDLHVFVQYVPAWKAMTRALEKGVRDGTLNTLTMEEAGRFTQRFVKTQTNFRFEGGKLFVELKNDEGLQDLALSLPKRCAEAELPKPLLRKGEVIYVHSNPKALAFSLSCAPEHARSKDSN